MSGAVPLVVGNAEDITPNMSGKYNALCPRALVYVDVVCFSF